MKDLISFETAKFAKEKGFDWPSPFIVSEKGYDHSLEFIGQDFFDLENALDACLNTGNNYYLATTQSELQKWLRETHKLHIVIDPYFGSEYHNEGIVDWELTCVKNLITGENYLNRQHFDTYEQALEVGLFQALSELHV